MISFGSTAADTDTAIAKGVGSRKRVWRIVSKLAISMTIVSLCLMFCIMAGEMKQKMKIIAGTARSCMTKARIYVVLNIVIVTIGLNSRPFTVKFPFEMEQYPCSSSFSGSEVHVQKSSSCTESMEEELQKKHKISSNSNSNCNSGFMKTKMTRSSMNLSEMCCNQAALKSAETRSWCSTENCVVVFEIRGEADEEEQNYSRCTKQKGQARQRRIRGKEMKISRDELYHKAETFIENFRTQLRMQRDDSRNQLTDC